MKTTGCSSSSRVQEHPPVCRLHLFLKASAADCCIPLIYLSFQGMKHSCSSAVFLGLSWHAVQRSSNTIFPHPQLLAWRPAKLRLSGSTRGSMRPLRCLSKQRLERNRCLGSRFRLETLTGFCVGLPVLPSPCRLNALGKWFTLFLSQLLQKVLFLSYVQSSFAI